MVGRGPNPRHGPHAFLAAGPLILTPIRTSPPWSSDAGHGAVRDPSRAVVSAVWGRACCAPPRPTRPFMRRSTMADLAYTLLLIGGFALLVLMLRGLESL